jgi:serine/threonine protein kinase
LKDSKFLKTILPLSPELDSILRRIFECDPQKRISIPELRELVLHCPRFTTHSTGLMTPGYSPVPSASPVFIYPHFAPNVASPPPSSQFASPTPEGLLIYEAPLAQYTASSGSSDSDGDSVFSAASTGSSCSECHYVRAPPVGLHKYIPQPINTYGNILPVMDLGEKLMVAKPFGTEIPVY